MTKCESCVFYQYDENYDDYAVSYTHLRAHET